MTLVLIYYFIFVMFGIVLLLILYKFFDIFLDFFSDLINGIK